MYTVSTLSVSCLFCVGFWVLWCFIVFGVLSMKKPAFGFFGGLVLLRLVVS